MFPSEVGTPINSRNLDRWFAGLLDRAGVPHVRFHDLRHTSATLLLRVDGRILVARQRLGHRDPATTSRYYGHVLDGDQRAGAAKAIASILGEPGEPSKPTREVKG